LLTTGEKSEVAAQQVLDRRLAGSLVLEALTTVLPADQRPEPLDEQLELYADLGMDSLRFIRLLVELEEKLGVPLDDEELMETELVTVADLVDLVRHLAVPAAQ
jgi:acyl carrier protein